MKLLNYLGDFLALRWLYRALFGTGRHHDTDPGISPLVRTDDTCDCGHRYRHHDTPLRHDLHTYDDDRYHDDFDTYHDDFADDHDDLDMTDDF